MTQDYLILELDSETDMELNASESPFSGKPDPGSLAFRSSRTRCNFLPLSDNFQLTNNILKFQRIFHQSLAVTTNLDK